VAEIVPQAVPAHPLPVTLHVTAVLEEFETLAVNCLVLPTNTDAVVGEMETETGKEIVTIADADFEVSAFEVAVTVTCAGLGTDAGAV